MTLTIDKWIMDFLRDEAERQGIGMNECFDRMMRKGMELEKKKRETIAP
jgi:hypothetical protein